MFTFGFFIFILILAGAICFLYDRWSKQKKWDVKSTLKEIDENLELEEEINKRVKKSNTRNKK